MLTLDEIKSNESKNIEFKEAIPLDYKKFLKTVVAYSNCAGGKIIFGIQDGTLEVVGIKDDIHQTIDKLTNIISDSITPQIIPNIYVENMEGIDVIVLEVFHGSNTPYYITSLGKEKGTFIRTVGSTRPADELMLRELTLSGLDRSFDELVYELKTLSIEDIDKTRKALYQFAKENSEHPENVKELTMGKMESWKLIHEVEGKFYPSNTYMMLQENNPFQFMTIQCARFKGTERVIFIDKKEYGGPLYEQIDNAHKFVLNHINMSLVGDGLVSSKNFEIPSKVIREIVCNAVGHRLIRAHSCVQVAIYDDRVEVTSPGGLFGGLTIDKMLQGRTAIRNTCIANVLSYVELIEHWGTGIVRVLSLCKEVGIQKPDFIDMGDAIRVIIYRPSYQKLLCEEVNDTINDRANDKINLSKNAVLVFNWIKENPHVTKEELAKLINKSKSTVDRAIYELKNKGYLEEKTFNKNGQWIIKGKINDKVNEAINEAINETINDKVSNEVNDRKNADNNGKNADNDEKNDKVNLSKNATVNETVNETVKLNRTEKIILSIIQENLEITLNEISKRIEKHRTTVARSINSLKEKGVLIRQGSDKTGYWKIKK